LGNLSGLEMLSLYENSFYGSLPDSMYGLKSLKSMILYSNKFTGILSSAIVNLSNLENINLFDNDFKGRVPLELEKLPLKKLNLSYNLFTGLVSNKLSLLDKLNMTMRNEMGNVVSLSVIKG
jgi:hypothetical protein